MQISIYFSKTENDIIIDTISLLEKLLLMHQSNIKIGILCENEIVMNNLDKALWTVIQNSFIPHTIVTNDEKIDIYPILLSDNFDKISFCQMLFIYGSVDYLNSFFENITEFVNNINNNSEIKITTLFMITYYSDTNDNMENSLNFNNNNDKSKLFDFSKFNKSILQNNKFISFKKKDGKWIQIIS